MEPISDTSATQRNTPHDLLARLYREIGVSAVAAALGVVEVAPLPQGAAAVASPDTTRQAA